MNLLALLALFVALAASAPVSEEDDETLTIGETFFPDALKIHTAEHDVISIVYPLNALNFEEDEDTDDADAVDVTEEKVFFYVEADITNGVQYKGLSVFKNGNATKILPTGTSASAANDNTKTAYFGATDGIYKYNAKDNTAEKYGPITDSIIDIAKVNGSDLIYILTDTNELYKVTEDATKKDKIADVVGAKQIVLDYSNNLYYYGEDKKPNVVTAGGIKKIEGLPSDPKYIKLLNPAFVLEDSVPIVLDNQSYIIYANGSSESASIQFEVQPSAYAIEGTLIQYFARNKSIYEYNILEILLNDLLADFKSFLDSKENEIQSIATRSRNDLTA